LCSRYSPCRKQAHLSRTELLEALSPLPLQNNNDNNNNPSSSLVSSSSNNKNLHHCATSWDLFYMQIISLSSWQPKETQRVVTDQYIALMSTGKMQSISLYRKKKKKHSTCTWSYIHACMHIKLDPVRICTDKNVGDFVFC
jgi:hypothetical protein